MSQNGGHFKKFETFEQVKADRRSSDSSQITHLEDFLKQVVWVTRTSDISF